MPLESLRQPFDPEQAGHKLREVQVEHEPQKEETARQHFERLKKLPIYDQHGDWRQGVIIESGKVKGWDKRAESLAMACEGALGNALDEKGRHFVKVNAAFHRGSFVSECSYTIVAEYWQDKDMAKKNYSEWCLATPQRDFEVGVADRLIYLGLLLQDPGAKKLAEAQQQPDMDDLNYAMDKILWKTELDPVDAQKYWKQAKERYYDKESGIFFPGNDNTFIHTDIQLKAVLIEARLEAKGIGVLKDEPVKLPEERQF